MAFNGTANFYAMMRRRGVTLAVLALFALGILAVPAHAADLVSVKINMADNPSVSPGSTVSIDNVFNGIPSGSNVVIWIAVGVPGGQVYLFEPGLGHYLNFNGGVSGGSIVCSVPFGGSGSLSTSGATGTATVSNCSGSNPLWKLSAATETYTSLQTDCSQGVTPGTGLNPATGGDTSLSGTYGVIACYFNGSPIYNWFLTFPGIFSVPEFGSLAFLLALGVGLVLVRRRVWPGI